MQLVVLSVHHCWCLGSGSAPEQQGEGRTWWHQQLAKGPGTDGQGTKPCAGRGSRRAEVRHQGSRAASAASRSRAQHCTCVREQKHWPVQAVLLCRRCRCVSPMCWLQAEPELKRMAAEHNRSCCARTAREDGTNIPLCFSGHWGLLKTSPRKTFR